MGGGRSLAGVHEGKVIALGSARRGGRKESVRRVGGGMAWHGKDGGSQTESRTHMHTQAYTLPTTNTPHPDTLTGALVVVFLVLVVCVLGVGWEGRECA